MFHFYVTIMPAVEWNLWTHIILRARITVVFNSAGWKKKKKRATGFLWFAIIFKFFGSSLNRIACSACPVMMKEVCASVIIIVARLSSRSITPIVALLVALLHAVLVVCHFHLHSSSNHAPFFTVRISIPKTHYWLIFWTMNDVNASHDTL